MTNTEPQTPIPPTSQVHQHYYCHGRGRGRVIFFSIVLLLIGGIIGAALSRNHGWRAAYYGGAYGPWGGHYAMSYSPDGQRAEFRFGGPNFGGGFFPGRIERAVDYVLGGVDASSEQKQKVRTIAEKAADDI